MHGSDNCLSTYLEIRSRAPSRTHASSSGTLAALTLVCEQSQARGGSVSGRLSASNVPSRCLQDSRTSLRATPPGAGHTTIRFSALHLLLFLVSRKGPLTLMSKPQARVNQKPIPLGQKLREMSRKNAGRLIESSQIRCCALTGSSHCRAPPLRFEALYPPSAADLKNNRMSVGSADDGEVLPPMSFEEYASKRSFSQVRRLRVKGSGFGVEEHASKMRNFQAGNRNGKAWKL